MAPADETFDVCAERLYQAVVELLHDKRMGGLLTAVGDAKDGLDWNDASVKTRDVFRFLVRAANLTDGAAAR